MPIVLHRVDERLLHGQVVVGWGRRLGIGFYVVVDDGIAECEWERELYASALPADSDVYFLTVAETIRRLPEFEARRDAGILLTADTVAMRRLAEAGRLAGHAVNLGGLHSAPGRERLLDYVFLSASETEDVRVIGDLAASVSARDLPGSPEVGLERLLRSVERARR